MRQILFCAMVVLAATPLHADEPRRVITVTAQSEHRVTPDEAIIDFSIRTLDDKLLVSKEQNDTLTSKVAKAIKKQGVASDNFKVTRLSMGPSYYNSRFMGYEVTRSFEVRTKDFAKLDRLISAIVGAGEDNVRVDDLHIQVQDQRKHQAEARRLAVEYAKVKAADLAELNEMRLGPVISITENVESNYDAGGFGGFGGGLGASTTPKPLEEKVAAAEKPSPIRGAKMLLVAMPNADDKAPDKAEKPKVENQEILSAIGQVSLNATVKIEFELLHSKD